MASMINDTPVHGPITLTDCLPIHVIGRVSSSEI